MRTNSFIFVFVIFSLPIAIDPALNPQQVSSVNGVLDVILVADNTAVNLNGKLVSLLLWNGSYIPPTLRLNPGDNFTLTVFNRLKMSTNVHFHGLTISPLAPADNSLLEISGMTSYRYSFQLSTQHSSGLFYYHAHTKDTSETQVFQGLSGLIIVEGLLKNNYPSSMLTGISEVIMALKDLQIENSTTADATVPLIQNLGMPSICTVNGLVNPVINITPNEVQLWRIANAGANRFYELSFSPNITLWEIAQDGSHLNQLIPWTQNSSRLLGPGNRIELLVVGPPEGIYIFQTLRIVSGKHGPIYPQVTLATLNSTGTPMPYKLLPNTSVSPLPNLQYSNVKRQRTLEFAMMEDSMMMMSGGMTMPNTSSTGADPLVKATWTINDKTFDPNRVDIRVNLGDTEEWTIRNKDQELHNFHIHQVHFQVVSIDKVPQPFNGYMDTITIPAAEPDNGKPYGEVKLLIPFTDPTIIGKFAFHCHILKHEDNGMMSLIEVASSSGGKLITQETGILLLLSTLIVYFLAMVA